MTAMEILVEGRVQGVGYRAFVQRRAQEAGLTGYALNLHDGRVRIRVEGERARLEQLVRDLATGPPLAAVSRVTATEVPYSGRFADFRIRFAE